MIVFNDNAEQTSLAVITCCRWSWLRSYYSFSSFVLIHIAYSNHIIHLLRTAICLKFLSFSFRRHVFWLFLMHWELVFTVLRFL